MSQLKQKKLSEDKAKAVIQLSLLGELLRLPPGVVVTNVYTVDGMVELRLQGELPETSTGYVDLTYERTVEPRWCVSQIEQTSDPFR